MLLTSPPCPSPIRGTSIRLACLKRAASVRSEPGSNSPLFIIKPFGLITYIKFVLPSSWLHSLSFPVYYLSKNITTLSLRSFNIPHTDKNCQPVVNIFFTIFTTWHLRQNNVLKWLIQLRLFQKNCQASTKKIVIFFKAFPACIV